MILCKQYTLENSITPACCFILFAFLLIFSNSFEELTLNSCESLFRKDLQTQLKKPAWHNGGPDIPQVAVRSGQMLFLSIELGQKPSFTDFPYESQSQMLRFTGKSLVA